MRKIYVICIVYDVVRTIWLITRPLTVLTLRGVDYIYVARIWVTRWPGRTSGHIWKTQKVRCPFIEHIACDNRPFRDVIRMWFISRQCLVFRSWRAWVWISNFPALSGFRRRVTIDRSRGFVILICWKDFNCRKFCCVESDIEKIRRSIIFHFIWFKYLQENQGMDTIDINRGTITGCRRALSMHLLSRQELLDKNVVL